MQVARSGAVVPPLHAAQNDDGARVPERRVGDALSGRSRASLAIANPHCVLRSAPVMPPAGAAQNAAGAVGRQRRLYPATPLRSE